MVKNSIILFFLLFGIAMWGWSFWFIDKAVGGKPEYVVLPYIMLGSISICVAIGIGIHKLIN